MLPKQKKRSKIRYLVISALLHVTFLTLASLMSPGGGFPAQEGKKGEGGYPNDTSKILPKAVEVEIVEAAPQEDGDEEFRVELPKIEKQDPPKKGDSGFWGIGIYISFHDAEWVRYNGQDYPSEKIGETIQGNPAWKHGLQKGDLIFMINGKTLAEENIKGDGPKTLRLGIKRGGRIFFITIEREWIETERGKSP